MPGKIRVLQIIKTLNISGAERFAVQLASCLDPNFYEVQVCAFFHEGGSIEEYWFDELNGKGIVTWYAAEWHGLNHLSSYLQGIKKVENRLRRWPADIINTHFQLGSLAGLYCRSRRLTKRMVRTAQNHNRKEWSPGLYGWLRHKLIGGWLYPIACDAEVGVSRAVVEELRRNPGARFAHRPAELITNAIPSDLIERAQTYPRPARDPGKPIVGSIGRLMPQKGYTYLLNAIPQVRAAVPGVEFWLIGDGELRVKLEEQVQQLNIADCVRFLGRQTDVLTWLRQMDLFVLPSLWEGFPLVIMESMAAGIPVVATDIPGTCDLIQHGSNGWLVSPSNSDALAATIISALRDPEKADRMARNAIAGLQALQIDRITSQYDRLYREILGREHPQG